MAQDKDDRPTASIKRPTDAVEEKRPSAATRSAQKGANGGGVPASVTQRRQQYLIGVQSMAAYQMVGAPRQAMDAIVEHLEQQDDVEVIKRIKPGGFGGLAAGGGGPGELVVARIDEAKAEAMRAAAQPHVLIERNAFLNYADVVPIPAGIAGSAGILQQPLRGPEISVRVIGEREQPIAKASIVVYGTGLPAQAVTDEGGMARLTLSGGPVESARAVYVKPAANYWERFIRAPDLNGGSVNTIKLRPLTETIPSFANERLIGWGQRLMRLDQLGEALTGSGVRVGIIDSGCDASHRQLRHVTRGKDFTNGGSEAGWSDDAIQHGTHAAGLIAASASSGQSIVGFAPEAELHVLKVVPGGRLSDLVAALDECIARELDIVSINVGIAAHSEIVQQRLLEARAKGIACFAAAGDYGGPVQVPAALPTVLAVAAVGKIREFPSDTGHAQGVLPHLVGNDGIFAAAFSCVGPEVALSAPGVAIVSTAPGGGYAALDGTSIAAAQVSGMAALVLAHHPLFQGPFKARSAHRVDALFGLICSSAVPHFADPLRGGAGVPDLQRLAGLQALPSSAYAMGAIPGLAPGFYGVMGANPQASPAGDRFAGGLPPFAAGVPQWPHAGAQGWQALMQLRAAGLI